MRIASALLSASLIAACGSHASGVTVDVAGAQGEPIPAINVTDILVVDLSVVGVSGTAVVDTGSPIVALDPSAFAGASLPNGAGTISSLVLGSLTFTNPDVVGANLIASPDPSIPIGGSLGCGILCAFAVSLDYRGSTVTLGSAPPPANVETPGSSVSFSLAGGGTESLDGVPGDVTFPASRIVLETTIEGSVHSLLVDTGSSFMLLRQTLFQSLVSDGRAAIGGIGTAAVGVASTSSVTRLRSVVVGGEAVEGLVAADDPNLEETLDDLASEVGHPVDGLIGGSFLRQFYVTIDYPAGVLALRRYTEGGPAYDTFDRVGVALASGSDDAPAKVTQVFAGTDAEAKGVRAGDVVVSIDGHVLATLGSTAIDALLSGPTGSTKTFQFGATSAAALSGASVSLDVNDLLPL